MCLMGGFSADSVTEFHFEKDQKTKSVCDNCKYSHWDE